MKINNIKILNRRIKRTNLIPVGSGNANQPGKNQLDRRKFVWLGVLGAAWSALRSNRIFAAKFANGTISESTPALDFKSSLTKPPEGMNSKLEPTILDWTPPVQLDYEEKDGIYMLTYGSTTESPVFEQKMDIALSLNYIKGISHYMEWRKLEPRENEYDWRQLDLVFERVKNNGKYCIIGVQAGVMAPEWLLRRPIVNTVDFIHNNPGWTKWSTIQTPVEVYGNKEILSRMALPWDPEYNRCLEKTLEKIAERYSGESCISFINICGPSASAGVEANFNIKWELSRVANPRFDQELGFTLEKYASTWKASIDANMRIFQKPLLCVGLHDQIGLSGYEGGRIVYYTEEERMEHARDIRDYFLRQYFKVWATPGVIRSCGMNQSESWWGNPDTIEDKPASNFTALQWEVRDRAKIGYEAASVSNKNGSLSPDVFARVVHNGITGYGRYLEIKVPDIVYNMKAYEPYRPVLEEAARIMCGK